MLVRADCFFDEPAHLVISDWGSEELSRRCSVSFSFVVMETKLEQIAVKARREPNLRFTSLAHHITRDRVLENLSRIPKRSAAGVDGQTVEAAKESFEGWIEPVLQSIHRQGYRAPNIRRVYIPKPGKTEKRPTRGSNCRRPGAPTHHG